MAPLQLPLASQLVASLLLQFSVTLSPGSTVVALAENDSVGGSGFGMTVTVTVSSTVPFGPLQVSV